MPIVDDVIPIPRRSARSLVYDQLTVWIENGVLEPDEVIKDSEIAKRLGVSRTPVREALQMLERSGAVHVIPGRSVRVASARPEDAMLIYPPLAALHAVAGEVGTPATTADDLACMRTLNDQLLDAVIKRDAARARDVDDLFHDVLVRRANNHYLSGAIESLQIHTRRLSTLYFEQVGPAHESYEEHQAIMEAVERGDAVAAAERTRSNFMRSVVRPVTYLDSSRMRPLT